MADIAWVCRPQLFKKFYKHLKQNKSLFLIYDTIDLHFQRIKREWDLKGGCNNKLRKKWKKYFALEKYCASKASLTITVTDDEKKVIDEWQSRCSVIPNIHNSSLERLPSFSERDGLLFIGSYQHPPNVDAAIWLSEEIMPLVWQINPEIHLTLLGSNPTPEVLNLRSSRISVPGFIKDVSTYFKHSKVFASPLRYGAGMKGKIGQSMSYGLPVVTTSIGAEGMYLKNRINSIIEDEPADFARAICDVYVTESIWNDISKHSLMHMEKFSSKVVSEKIALLLQNNEKK